MKKPAALSADLRALGGRLEPPDQHDLEASVRSLRRDVALSVRSLVGLALTVTSQDEPVTLTSIEEWVELSDIRSSLEVVFTPTSVPATTSVITFYAENPEAFTDLAGDLSLELLAARPSWDSTSALITIRVDSALTPGLLSGLSGLPELSMLNRALGVLIARGHTLDDAMNYLTQRTTAESGRLQIAVEVLTAASLP